MPIAPSRRRFVKQVVTTTILPSLPWTVSSAAVSLPWHEQLASKAKQLTNGQPLKLLVPEGSQANVKAATDEFTRLSSVVCEIEAVAVDDINVELILRTSTGDASVDVALPATFGLTNLVQARAIRALDDFAAQHEPENLNDGYLYRKGDRYRGKLYGYQTDGDAYLLFYNKAMLLDPDAQQAYLEQTGMPLAPARTWQELDRMMAFFHKPDQNQYGGSLFRNPNYLVWEWWARFHANAQLPFSADMSVNINNSDGVAALEELIAATRSLSPGSLTNGLFDNWEDFGRGNVFCNIGWGGTQKYLMSQPHMANNLIHSPLPGPPVNGEPSSMGYFNWGWNYTVSALSTQPELAYLLALFSVSPTVSILAVREPQGFFDPFHECHYDDEEIRQVYGSSFLEAHEQSLSRSLPDLYISGQSNYLDELRQYILSALNKDLSAKEALDTCAQRWAHITRRMGHKSQTQQWLQLVNGYPAGLELR